MSGAGTRLGVGTRFRLDGETVEVVEFASLATGMEVILKDSRDRLTRMSVRELLASDRADVIAEDSGPAADEGELASVVLSRLTKQERKDVLERAGHVREVLSGFRSGSEELARPGEPRPDYAPGRSLSKRYAAKASELGVTARSVERWASAFQQSGEVGLVPKKARAEGGLAHADRAGSRRPRRFWASTRRSHGLQSSSCWSGCRPGWRSASGRARCRCRSGRRGIGGCRSSSGVIRRSG